MGTSVSGQPPPQPAVSTICHRAARHRVNKPGAQRTRTDHNSQRARRQAHAKAVTAQVARSGVTL